MQADVYKIRLRVLSASLYRLKDPELQAFYRNPAQMSTKKALIHTMLRARIDGM